MLVWQDLLFQHADPLGARRLRRSPGAGFFPAAQAPLFVSNPENGLKNIKNGAPEDKFQARMKLADELDKDFRTTFPHRNVKAYADMYDDAMAMMKSEDHW